ncbi:reverse transcriptase domain-containing protein [Tanacetum coccineum]
MTHLLEKNTPFIFSDDCIRAFQTLKNRLTEAPILIAPNWDLPFELMCDAMRFRIVHTDHSALKYLLAKKGCQGETCFDGFSSSMNLTSKVFDTKGERELDSPIILFQIGKPGMKNVNDPIKR